MYIVTHIPIYVCGTIKVSGSVISGAYCEYKYVYCNSHTDICMWNN